MATVTKSSISAFQTDLYQNEKSCATVQKYLLAVEQLGSYLHGREIEKGLLIEYRDHLQKSLKVQSVNGRLSAINAYLDFCGLPLCKVRLLRVQQQAFLNESRELSRTEYQRLLNAAKAQGNERLYLLMLTLCSTGIRVSELRFITVEAAQAGRAEISLKGKNRTVILQKELSWRLLNYAKDQNIQTGCIFCTKNGIPLDRSNICHSMKRLCSEAQVDRQKVFPHNLRHLFARSYYDLEKDLSHLADILGHSHVETTRIYVAASASTHLRTLQKMDLII